MRTLAVFPGNTVSGPVKAAGTVLLNGGRDRRHGTKHCANPETHLGRNLSR